MEKKNYLNYLSNHSRGSTILINRRKIMKCLISILFSIIVGMFSYYFFIVLKDIPKIDTMGLTCGIICFTIVIISCLFKALKDE